MDLQLRPVSMVEGQSVPGLPLISVIDDDESLRVALTGLVRSLGYEARAFASAEDFLGTFMAGAVSCVISDIQMPGMSGIDMLNHLAARNIDLPVIAISGRPDPTLEQKALAAGAVCFLRKPFEADALICCLEKALTKQD
ncbi:MAG: response regulator [Hyphomicrobiaceae bacterium]|nr:response regulator [Hyphomicrobiaceae bacterium]